MPSLSEWGCIKNRPRKFDELGAMMSSDMTSVYSGGLMYEYSVEGNGYGIVKIKGDDVDTTGGNNWNEFKNYASALSANPAPTGDGGAAKETHSVDCPSKDKDWNIDSNLVPVMPQQAEKYMKKGGPGAGPGPGFKGSGSQNAGDSGTATTSTTGGVASPTSKGDNAGMSLQPGMDKAPIVVCGLTLFFTLFGAVLL